VYEPNSINITETINGTNSGLIQKMIAQRAILVSQFHWESSKL